MRRNELIRLRELVQEEIDKRKRNNELLENELIKEYLKINNIEPQLLDKDNIREIIKQILSNFPITKTNGIYICTAAWYSDCDICYEETSYTSRNVSINSSYAESKTYSDIELGNYIYASKEGSQQFKIPSIKKFEENNLVLNPYNTSVNKNGFEEVQMLFFETALKDGQARGKRLVLAKYPRI
jgi:hypothetical protein